MYSTVSVIIDTDVDGTMQMQFSHDGSDWDRVKQIDMDTEIGEGSAHSLAVVGKYFRVVYINGSTAQSHFHLQTIFHGSKSPFLVSSPLQVVSRIDDVQLTRVFNEVAVDMAHSLYADRFVVQKFGGNDDVGTGAFEDVWANGGVKAWPTSAETVRIAAGGDVNDTAAGSGAQSVVVEGLDGNWDRASETLATNGASASSATSTTFSRVHRAYVGMSGTYGGVNAAAIIVENTSSAQVLANIPTGLGQTSQSHYSVPAGFSCYVMRYETEVDAVKPAEVRLWRRPNGDDVATPFSGARVVNRDSSATGYNNIEFRSPIFLAEKTDIWVSALASSGGGATNVQSTYDLWCMKNATPTVPQ